MDRGGYGVVPMEFGTLVDRMVKSEELKTAIYKLLRRKEDGQELDREPRIPIISEFIEKELDRLGKGKFEGNSFRPDTEKLDDLFRLALEEIWEKTAS